SRAGLLDFTRTLRRPLRTSWLMVGMEFGGNWKKGSSVVTAPTRASAFSPASGKNSRARPDLGDGLGVGSPEPGAAGITQAVPGVKGLTRTNSKLADKKLFALSNQTCQRTSSPEVARPCVSHSAGASRTV